MLNIVEFCNEFAKEEKNNSVVFIVASWKTFSHSDWIFSDVSLIIILINLFYSCYMWLINDFSRGRSCADKESEIYAIYHNANLKTIQKLYFLSR